jgi:hypothetical protein
MFKAQADYLRADETLEYNPRNRESPRSAQSASPVPERELKDARRKLCDAACGFAKRCLTENLVDEARLRKDFESLGIEL